MTKWDSMNRVGDRLVEFFNNDREKIYKWFCTKNPGLGDITPLDLVLLGRYERLEKFIHNRLEGNVP